MAEKSLDTALDLKLKGNEHFKKNEFKEAIGLYTHAIEACPPHRYSTFRVLVNLHKFAGV